MENTENMENSKKKKNLSIVLVIILLVVSCAFSFYLGVRNANKDIQEEKQAEKQSEKQEEKEPVVESEPEEPVEKPEVVSFDKVKANEGLDTFMLAFQTTGMNDDETIIGTSRRNKVELLDNKTKLKLAWYYIFKSGNSDKIMMDASPDGEEVSGSAGVELNFFKEFYKKMFGSDLVGTVDYSVLGYDKDAVKNNILYGTMASGMSEIPTAFKASSITKTNDVYELVIDVIYEDVEDDLEEAKIYPYLDSEKVSYPAELVIYHVKITYKIVENNYVIQSMVAY